MGEEIQLGCSAQNLIFSVPDMPDERDNIALLIKTDSEWHRNIIQGIAQFAEDQGTLVILRFQSPIEMARSCCLTIGRELGLFSGNEAGATE